MKNFLMIAFAFVFAAGLFSACSRSGNTADSQKKIEVVGSAEMEFVPDEIYMNFTLKEYLDKSGKKVKIETIKADFLLLCKDAGVPDTAIGIASYTGDERWDWYWYKRRKTQPDFMSAVSYSVLVSSTETLDKIVNVMNEDAIDNFYIEKTSHSKIEQFRKEVKTKALIAGKNKAENLAGSIGEKIGDALFIQEIETPTNNYWYGSNYSNEISQTSTIFNEPDASTPNFKKIKLRYEIKAVFELK